MGKNANKLRKNTSVADRLAAARRLIERGNLKEAIKDLKAAYRDQPVEEVRTLLEAVLFRRAVQLRGYGLIAEAKAIAESLFELPGPSGLPETDLVDLLFGLGMSDRAMRIRSTEPSPEQDSHLKKRAADQAVLRPEHASGPWPEIAAGARQIREVLQAIERSQDDAAAERLAGIPRSSPFADWKLFCRGLIARYRESEEECRANWGRLEPGRAAIKIAGALGLPSDSAASAGAAAPVASGLTGISRSARQAREIAAFGHPVCERLRFLEAALRDEKLWSARDAAGVLRTWLKDDLAVSRRVTAAVLGSMDAIDSQEDGDWRDWSSVVHRLEPLHFDPQWKRWAALQREETSDPKELYRVWSEFIHSAATNTQLAEDERGLIVALTRTRLAKSLAQMHRNLFVESDSGLRPKWFGQALEPVGDPEPNEWGKVVIDELRRAIALRPDLSDPFGVLGAIYLGNDCEAAAGALYREHTAAQPDNFEVALAAGVFFADRDEAEQAAEYVRRVQELRPLDRSECMLSLLWRLQIAWARRRAKRGEWQAAREALAEAGRAASDREDKEVAYRAIVRCALESVAEEAGAASPAGEGAEHWRQEALRMLDHPAPVALGLVVETRLAGGSIELQKRCYREWKSTLKKRRTAAAGVGTIWLLQLYASESPCLQADELLETVGTWFESCLRVGFAKDELLSICRFMRENLPGCAAYPKLLAKGCSKFGKCAYFPYWYAQWQLIGAVSDVKSNRVLKLLTKAKRLAARSTDPEEHNLFDEISRVLRRVEMLYYSYYDPSESDEFEPDEAPSGRKRPNLPVVVDVGPIDIESFRGSSAFERLDRLARDMGIDLEEIFREHFPDPT